MINADLTKNDKQIEFISVLTKIINGESPVRNIHIGGAIRGGKTFVTFCAAVILCLMYPGIKGYIIRESFPTLRSTSIPSMEKILKGADVKWHKNPSDYHVEFKNGSKIYFFSENYAQDKDLDRFKGLEANFFILEQIEELQEATFMKCIERVGSWYIDPMPPALTFSTFNPSYNWVKDKLYEPAIAGLLPETDYYITALPNDNPFVTQDQWNAWNRLDDDSKARFIMGSWNIDVKGQFMHKFNREKHIDNTLSFRTDEYVRLSFDFNVDPMTCTVYQTDCYTYYHIIKEYRIPDSDIYEMCELIRKDFWYSNDLYNGEPYFLIRGDAAGANRSSAAKHHINHYDIIKEELQLGVKQFNIPASNPGISESRVFCNSVFQHFPNFKINEDLCPWTVKDLMFCLATIDGDGRTAIAKKGKNPYINMDNNLLGHLLDTVRYGIHTDLVDFIKIPKS